MPIPVITLQSDQDIVANPRRQAIYDTEGDNDATAIALKLTCFSNLNQFSVASLSYGPAKVYGRDTNLENTGGGSIPKGSMMLGYDLTIPLSVRTSDLSATAGQGIFQELWQIRKARWATFRFGETPYFRESLEDIPAGWGVKDVTTTCAAALVTDIGSGRLSRFNRRSLLVNDYPIMITQNEQFAIDLERGSDFSVTPTYEVYYTPHIHGIYLRGITG